MIPLSGSRVVECGQTEGRTEGQTEGRTDGQTEGRTDGQTDWRTDGQTEITKLIVTFRNFANAHKMYSTKNSECYTNQFCSKLLALNIWNLYVKAAIMRYLRATWREWIQNKIRDSYSKPRLQKKKMQRNMN